MSVEKTLEERGSRYGSFEQHSIITQAIKEGMRIFPNRWDNMPPIVKQCFEVIADKMARAINGDEFYVDNYHDIAGYATLVEKWAQKLEDDILELTEEHELLFDTDKEFINGTATFQR